MKEEILEFIKRRFNNDCHWLDGNCYYFAVILKTRFPEGEIVYDDIDGHFLFEVDGQLYDWTGATERRDFIYWKDFESYDALLHKRIIRDCIK